MKNDFGFEAIILGLFIFCGLYFSGSGVTVNVDECKPTSAKARE